MSDKTFSLAMKITTMVIRRLRKKPSLIPDIAERTRKILNTASALTLSL